MAERICKISDCGKPVKSRGWCPAHYRRWSLYGDPLGSAPTTFRAVCSMEDCGRPHIAQGFCTMHYCRWQKHGDPTYVPEPKARPACTVEDCSDLAVARSWCRKHWATWRRTGDPATIGYGQTVQPCTIAGCERPGTGPRGSGWCPTHYRRFERHGSPYVTSRIVGDDAVRFETYLRLGLVPEHAPELGPCWLWTGPVTKDGYGVMQVGDLPTASAHRWSYRHHVGDLVEDLELDHLCRVRRCVNAWHLEQVPHVVNLARSNALRAS